MVKEHAEECQWMTMSSLELLYEYNVPSIIHKEYLYYQMGGIIDMHDKKQQAQGLNLAAHDLLYRVSS